MAVKTVPIALHYFRLPRPAWELMLTRMRQLGATTIFTPVPWGFHQLAEDRVDLRGLTNPRRDLAGFVDVCLAMRFRVRLELAPAPDDDLLHGGLPGRLLNRNPEIRAKDRAGHPLPTPSMGHPTYLKRLEGWFNELARVLAGKVSPGGPVEPQFTPGDPGLDFNDHAATVQWPIWLRKRYAEGGIDALNAAYAPPTPFSGIGQVSLSAPLDSPAFRQDVDDFAAHLRDHTRQTIHTMLESAGLPPAEPLAPPPHGAQVNPDPPDVGTGLRRAMDAPVRADGSPRPEFWAVKAQNFDPAAAEPAQLFYAPPGEAMTIEAGDTPCFRLLLTGQAERVIPNGNAVPYIHTGPAGHTDFYFTLPNPDAPLTGPPGDYLASLLAGQQHALSHSLALTQQLLAACQPPPPPSGAPAPAPLSEAQAALTEANIALQKAAASIGALEDAFAAALDKPHPEAAPLPLFKLDAATFRPLQQTCQTASALLQTAIEAFPAHPFSLTAYMAACDGAVKVGEQVLGMLGESLEWLREGLSAGQLPAPAAAAAHAVVQAILQTITAGVNRQ